MNLKNILPLFAALFFALSACGGSGQNDITADEFEKRIGASEVQLIDVRTPQEFAERHIAGAENIDINGNSFESDLENFDKSKPVYFYCLSGSRSAAAAKIAAAKGFKEIYNLKGGILSWINSGKEIETGAAASSGGMTQEKYLALINQPKMVLVDFNAVWCGPCKILKPRIENVLKQKSEEVELLEIDVDQNMLIADYMNVNAIPFMVLYKQGKEVWRQLGLAEESQILAAIEKAQ